MQAQGRSIVQTFIVSLSILLISILALMTYVSLYFSSGDTDREISIQSKETLTALANVLATPLWNFDDSAIDIIGETYFSLELINQLKIWDNNGNRLFARQKKAGNDNSFHEAEIKFKEQIIGKVIFSISQDHQRELSRKYLWPYLVSTLTMLLLTLTATLLFLRILIRKPFQWLESLALAFSAGNHRAFNTTSPYTEFQQLVNVLNATGGTISSQMNELQHSRDYLQLMVNNVADAIISIDQNGLVELWNPAATRVFGFKENEMLGKNIKTIIPPPHHARHDKYLQDYLKTGKSRILERTGLELEAQRKDGSVFPIELSVTQIAISGRRLYTGVINDISARKRIEKQKNEFISTLSHELRTPLTSIIGSLGILQALHEKQLSPEINQMLSMATRNSERLMMLINDLLDIQKMETGALDIHFETIDLDDVVSYSISLNRGYAEKHNIALLFMKEDSDFFVNGDRNRLIQVLSNLLSNAIKFSPEGQTVNIKLKKHGKDRVKVSISDRGQGIPVEFQPRLFQRFSQADSSDARRLGGTGLGLYICQTIIHSHKGDINFETTVGRGSTFYFTLPLTNPK
ncbi:MAG: ATP-binding protein [Gammaproteobacteria bacterium]|nr:ATP-binding protein [Gammaproteobacteria bacterium]